MPAPLPKESDPLGRGCSARATLAPGIEITLTQTLGARDDRTGPRTAEVAPMRDGHQVQSMLWHGDRAANPAGPRTLSKGGDHGIRIADEDVLAALWAPAH